ncbi:hypothetical protein WAE58_21745 [Pedobacter panaciterrae]|uniref:Phage minor structural protein GP20 n=1 Tax=Pedobacter panaciterrae TaxID=363849 RepID=A0ABU8NS38_9SPHI
MSLKIKIVARLKAKAAGVNLSKERIDAIVLRAEKGLTDESDDTAIDANLDLINELTPFKDIAALDDHDRAKAKKLAEDKEAARLKALEEGKTPEPELPVDTPEWMKAFIATQAASNKALQEQIAAIKGEKVTNTRREQIAKLLENTTDAYKADKLADFDLLGFKDDESFETYKTSLEARSKDFVKSEEADNGIGGAFKPMGGAGGGNSGTTKVIAEADLDAIMNAI